jgi:hypothetical protein
MFARMQCLSRPFALLLTLSGIASARAAEFTINYNAAPAEAQTAVQLAADIWGDILVSAVPIKVLVNWTPLGSTTLGITFPNGRRDFPDAPLPSTWYSTSLANSITGEELNPGENDFEIWLNSTFDWYYGTDGMPGNAQHDLVSVALHEFGHGLGFVGLSKKEGTVGSFGLLEMSDFAPLFTTFPWPELDTLPGVFDRYLSHSLNGLLSQMDNPSDALGTAQTSNQIYFNGPLAMAANNGNAPRIYAPSTFALGSSCVHLNESTYPSGNPNELMTPFSSAGDANHWPGPLCLAMLRDIGWILAPDVSVQEAQTMQTLTVYPNPAHEVIAMSLPAAATSTLLLIDAQGRRVMSQRYSPTVDVRDLSPGAYVLRVDGTSLNASFFKH